MSVRWNIKSTPSQELMDQMLLEMPSLSQDQIMLLLNRKIDSLPKAKDFFNPNSTQLHSPFLMKDMGIAVELLTNVISNNQKIMLYGDYDVDGTCSVSLAHLFLKTINANTTYYIPDRYAEGYGLSAQGVQYAIANKMDLVITMDCGIRSVELVQELRDANIRVIICDHHEPGTILPPANAVLDAKQNECKYPFKELCGCGVTFKLFHAFCMQQSIDEQQIFQFVDLLAVATCADIVPMVGENRVFVNLGIQKINSNPSLGLQTLKKKAGLESEINVRGVVFGFAPRINAAGRVAHASGAVDLLIATDPELAMALADKVEENNISRRELDKDITEEALQMIENSIELQHKKTTVLSHSNWHKGVIGIVASRCIEQHHKPTIIFKNTDGYLTGSARSVGNFDILEAITACDSLLDKYGGHKFAAGLSLLESDFAAFSTQFEQYVSDKINKEDLEASINIEQEVNLDSIDFKFHTLLKRFEPYGPQNMQPIFMVSNYLLPQKPTLLKEEHLKFCIQNKLGNLDCIGFGMRALYDQIDFGKPVDFAFCIEINEFKNTKKLQLMLRVIRQTVANT